MSIRDIRTFHEVAEQISQLKTLRYLRLLYWLMGAQGQKALTEINKLPELELRFEELRSTPDEFNSIYTPRMWVHHEEMNHGLARDAIALAMRGDIDAGEQLLMAHITHETVSRALGRADFL